MKTIFLQRHAKSSWGNQSLSDFERPLNERGLYDAPRMGKRLAASGDLPDLIISSTAHRALATANIIAAEINYSENKIQTEDCLYLIDSSSLLSFINKVNDDIDKVMIVAHNPGLTIFCEELCGAGISNIPTGACAKISFDVDDWISVHTGIGTLVEFDYPKRLND